jgi:circadian clock protein KaiB
MPLSPKQAGHPPAAKSGAGGHDTTEYLLRLYITGVTHRSTQALENIKKICEEHLHGRYKLEVIDLYQQPSLAAGEQIIAAPTLIKSLPLPLRRVIGTMSDEQRVLVGLDLRPRDLGK